MNERDTKAVIADLRGRYPEGLAGEREQLVTALMNDEGLEHREALALAEQLREEGFAHHLPGDSARWLFTERSVPFDDLRARLEDAYDDYRFEGEGEREELLTFMSAEMGLERDVADEVLAGLEQAGYTSVLYHEGAARDRMFVRFPDAFRPVA